MLVVLMAALGTLRDHVGASAWALAVFAFGFALAFPVVKLQVKSLLAFPMWLVRLARRYLRPEINPVALCTFIFAFNTAAIFVYMISGGLVYLPIVFDLFTGLNVGIIMLTDSAEPAPGWSDEADAVQPPRAWIGFLSIFVVVVELAAFWLAIGMGITLGHAMAADFSRATFAAAVGPRLLAYLAIIVPALAASAAAETAAIKAMLRPGGPEPPAEL